MPLHKFILPVMFLLIINTVSECRSLRSKYNESSIYYLDTNAKITEVIENLLKVIPGDIIKIEKGFKKNELMWKVNMIYGEGSVIKFEVSSDGNSILSIIADEGPYDYEIKPGASLIPYSSAKKTAENHTSKKVLKWNLKQNKDKYEYSFWLFTKSGKAHVKVDADTGDIITGRKKSVKKTD